jgi:outer membrane protein assembly factor BamB
MQIAKNKTTAIAIAIFLMLSMTTSIILVPNANAHTPKWTIPTYAYIVVSPNPIGVGQRAFVIMWLDKLFDAADPTNNYRFHNYNLIITDPDGTNTTVNFPVITDPTSAQPYTFTPTKVGNYTLTFSFPGQDITVSNDDPTSEFINDTAAPSSASTTLVVQQEAVPAAITSEPLPTSYWTRPVYGENTNWYTLESNWLGAGVPGYSGWGATSYQQSFPGDAVGSMTAHIMWTKPIQSGGIVGGNTVQIPGNTYFEGSAYSQRYLNPIILDGMLIYNPPISSEKSNSGPTTCVNLQNGQVIWTNAAMPAPSFGYIYDAEDPNQHGVWPPMLVSQIGGSFLGFPGPPATWMFFDAFTGDALFNLTNIPSGTVMLGPSGEMLILSLVNLGPTTMTPFGPVPSGPPQWYLQEWNSSRIWDNLYSGPSTTPDLPPPISDGQIAVDAQGTPTGQTVDATWTGGYISYEGYPTYVASLYDFNISMPTLTTQPTIDNAFYNNMVICENGSLPSGPWETFSGNSFTPYTYFAISLKTGSVGNVLWTNAVQPPAGNITVEPGPADPTANGGNGVFVEAYKETMQWVGYSMSTGQKIWGPTTSMAPFDYYGNPAIPIIGGVAAYGNLYSDGYAGILYAWNITTGNLEWTYGNGGEGNSTFAGFNTPFGVYPMQINAIGNGVVYLVTTEHTIETPLFKGAFAAAVNATDGAEIWTLSDYTGEFFGISFAMADGYNTWFNGYDNSVYSVGRGPSATTVTAPNVGLSFGTPIVIKGTVMDISAGTKQSQQAADFPNGVPCSSDASMKDWMGYVYQQQPLPTNFTGVPVTINVLDSNNNFRSIGTATTDATGTFRLTWTPDIPGNYTVIATFQGTNGYWPSYSEDGFNVMQAPAATTAPTPTPASAADLYFVPLSIGMIVAIVVIGALLAVLILRKRP